MNATVENPSATMQPATVHGVLSRGVPFAEWSARPPVLIPAEVEDAISVGEEVAIYHSHGHLFGTIVAGPRYPAIEALFGRAYAVYDIRVEDVVVTLNTRMPVRRADFDTAWHVYNDLDRVIAGGPRITRERAQELAASMGGTVRQG